MYMYLKMYMYNVLTCSKPALEPRLYNVHVYMYRKIRVVLELSLFLLSCKLYCT